MGGISMLRRYSLLSYKDFNIVASPKPRRKLTYRITGAAAIEYITPLLQQIPEVMFVEAPADAEHIVLSLKQPMKRM
jgi:hypothetical protein